MPPFSRNLAIFFGCIISVDALVGIVKPVGAAQTWFEVVPSLGSAVDTTSIRKVANEYEARLRWKVLNPKLDVYRAFNLPPNSFSVALERIVCTPRGAISYEVEHWYQSSSGQTLHHQVFDLKKQSLARVRSENWLADMSTVGSTVLSPYGSDPRSFVCAYATAKCAKRQFQWPIPNLTPLEGSTERLKMLNKAHTNQFLPTC